MKELIVRCKDGTLVCATDGRRWIVGENAAEDGYIVGLLFPPANLYRENAIVVVLANSEDKAECEAILESLGKRLGAVKWDSARRGFVPVGGSDG